MPFHRVTRIHGERIWIILGEITTRLVLTKVIRWGRMSHRRKHSIWVTLAREHGNNLVNLMHLAISNRIRINSMHQAIFSNRHHSALQLLTDHQSHNRTQPSNWTLTILPLNQWVQIPSDKALPMLLVNQWLHLILGRLVALSTHLTRVLLTDLELQQPLWAIWLLECKVTPLVNNQWAINNKQTSWV